MTMEAKTFLPPSAQPTEERRRSGEGRAKNGWNGLGMVNAQRSDGMEAPRSLRRRPSSIAKLQLAPSFISDALFAIQHRLVLLPQDSRTAHLPQVNAAFLYI